MLVYICAPYSAETPEEMAQNKRNAANYAEAMAGLGYDVFCPHLAFSFFDEAKNPDHRPKALAQCIHMVKRCDVIMVVTGPINRKNGVYSIILKEAGETVNISRGMYQEILAANMAKIPVQLCKFENNKLKRFRPVEVEQGCLDEFS